MSPSATLSSDSGGWEAAASSPAMARLTRDRASLCGLLATLFRRAPTWDTLLSLRSAELRNALIEAGMDLDDAFFTADVDALAEALAVEFAELFLLPGSMISPHESVQTKGGSGLLRGPETARVREYYEYVGFRVDDAIPMEPDHISIELEFLGHLTTEEAAAWEAGDLHKALDALRYQNDFLCRHLGQWAFGFLKRIQEGTGHGFYPEVARLATAFLEEQRDLLPQMIEQLQRDHATP